MLGQEPSPLLLTPLFAGDCDADDTTQAAAPKRWGKSRPFPALVSAVEGLCTLTSKDDKNTFRVEFSLGESGLAYLPGDALGIYPTNCSKVLEGRSGYADGRRCTAPIRRLYGVFGLGSLCCSY